MTQGGLISPVLFSLYVNDMLSSSHYVKLALYADDTDIIAKSRKTRVLVSYLESYLNDFQRLLSEWRFAVNVYKSTTIIFAFVGRRIIQPRTVTLFGEPIEWVDRTRYVGLTLDTRLLWSHENDQIRKRNAQKMCILLSLLIKKRDLSVRNGVLLYKQFACTMINYACPAWRPAALSHDRRLQVLQSKCLRLATGVLWYVTGRYRRTWEFRCLPTTSVPRLRASTQRYLTSRTPLYGGSVNICADLGSTPSTEA